MQTNTAVKLLPSIHEDKMLEVTIEGDETILKLSTWTENLGWNCQKTMRVEASMLDDLHRQISAARYKINRQKAGDVETSIGDNGSVIIFPTFA